MLNNAGAIMRSSKVASILAAALLLAGCGSPAPTGPWSRAYQMKIGTGEGSTEISSDGQGHLLYTTPAKDAEGRTKRQSTLYDLKNKVTYKWNDGDKGYLVEPTKDGDGSALYTSKDSIATMEKNPAVKKLDDKNICGVNCKGFQVDQVIPGFGYMGMGVVDRGMTLQQQLYVSPEFETTLSRSVNGSSLVATSFSGDAPDPSLFAPASGNSKMVNFTEQNQATQKNMQALKGVIEMYSSGHGGNFPSSAEEVKALLNDTGGYLNPCTNQREFPVAGGVGDVIAARQSKGKTMTPGSLEYNLLPGGRAYAIVGGDARAYALAQPNDKGTLVLSNM